MQQNIEFERCIDFLVRMIDKYGDEVLRELFKINRDFRYMIFSIYGQFRFNVVYEEIL